MYLIKSNNYFNTYNKLKMLKVDHTINAYILDVVNTLIMNVSMSIQTYKNICVLEPHFIYEYQDC